MANLSLLITIMPVERRYEDIRQVNDGLQEVQDFFHDKVGVDLKYDIYPVSALKDARIDFYKHSRPFPAIYLLDADTIYTKWLGYAHMREFAEIAGRNVLWPFTIVHELGHLFGLEHNVYSFMHSEIAQARKLNLINSTEKETLLSNIERYGRQC